jgi:hypothetical protein
VVVRSHGGAHRPLPSAGECGSWHLTLRVPARNNVACRGVAVITGVGVTRVETPAAEADAAGTPAADAAAPQPHGVSIWPHCDACEDPLLLHALQLAEPLAPLGLQLSVLPSEMPAELLMTYKGQVRARLA